jgi:hypothetical protein
MKHSACLGVMVACVVALLGSCGNERKAAPPVENPVPPTAANDSAETDLMQQRAGPRRAALELRWRKARSIAVEKWRADVLTANLLGEVGATPPMVSIREAGSEVLLRNEGPGPICVAVARITRPNTDAVERCQVGPADCSPVKPGATIRLAASRGGAKESCLHAAFEFRVGNVDSPEPTWWSRTAFNAFRDTAVDISYKEEADLHADIARFEATVEDADRAARWRREAMTR